MWVQMLLDPGIRSGGLVVKWHTSVTCCVMMLPYIFTFSKRYVFVLVHLDKNSRHEPHSKPDMPHGMSIFVRLKRNNLAHAATFCIQG